MTRNDRNAAIAAGLIMAFAVGGYFVMPIVVTAAGADISPYAGLALAGLFVLAPFAILWLRARWQRRQHD